ncbi:glycoside hydrolase family 47 protein [Streptomyces sp. SL13]|uniref:Glycoside hydrolase family 47 protein n=1 Tax=Streptantibioticus silvisoli TaxID=2705255 RepID=A0AA90HEI4_9ACTN|nr:glycoside hydrolase family 47 protein [Streptantibioticus silvisoli]MDI5967040.1 glycoside hydrolase family 47 protein [Streptantibioticus silvisoli]MDI5974225.1 glycoside hydrolase family 47 protein [Streptantibioticus silvisoli]
MRPETHTPRPAPRPASRRTVLGAAGAALAGATLLTTPAHAATTPATSPFAFAGGTTPLPSDRTIAAEIHAEFLHGWRGYTSVAWGHDEVCPVSGTSSDFFAPGKTFGLSMVEALDTLYVMGEDHELARSCDWIEANFDPTQDVDMHVFETIIRLVGGLLAGYLATGRPKLLALCRELTDRVMPAFTSSPTGIPYTHVNLATGAIDGNVVPLAEVGTNVMEFGLLSKLTGDSRYIDASMRAYEAVIGMRSSLDLLGTSVDAATGRWTDTGDTAPNPPVDSFYEYLWGGYALLGDKRLLEWYRTLTRAILTHQADTSTGHLWFRQVDSATGAPTGTAQSELGAFYAGLLGKGGDLAHGSAYYRSWTTALDRYPVLPEGIDYTTLAATDKGNQLRPEYVNSSFDLWRLDPNEYYKRTAYQYFTGMRDNLRVTGGYTIAADVTTAPMTLGDYTPAYWFAENNKYLYLTFADSPRFDYRNGILSTEGKVLRGLRRR